MEEQTTGLNAGTPETVEQNTTVPEDLFWFLESDAPATGESVSETEESPTGDSDTDADDGASDAPATGESGNAGDSNPPEETAGQGTEKKRRVLRFMDQHETKTFDVDSASDEELVDMIQRANQTERLKAKYERMKAAFVNRADAEKFRAFVQKEAFKLHENQNYNWEEAVDLATARAGRKGMKIYPADIAEDGTVSLTGDYADGRIPFDEDGDAPAPVQPESKRPAPPPEPMRDTFAEDVKRLKAAFPDMTELPKGVLELHKETGMSLTEAMLVFRDRASRQKAADLAKENKRLKQQLAAAAKAPVKGVSGGGKPPKDPDDDPFLRALNGGYRVRKR